MKLVSVASRLLAAAGLLVVAHPLAAQTQAAPPDVPVQVAPATRHDVPVLLHNIGAVQAYQSVLVRARVDGTLDKVLFREGQEVKAGDALAVIDPRPYAAVLAQVQAKKVADEAQLANARRDLTRTTNLARSDFASRQQLDTQGATVAQAEATIAGDEAAVATARLNVEFCTIVAPITGRTGLRQVDAGNLIHAADAQGIVAITQIHPIAMVFTLPQEVLPQLQAGIARGTLPVLAYAADDRTRLSEGHLLTIDNMIDQTTGTIRLKAEFANPDNRLWPGQFVNARLLVDTLKDALAVPSIAVQHGPDGLYVYVVKPDSTVAMQSIEVQQDDGTIAVISRGLDVGASVVTNGQSRLQSGTRVAVQKAAS